MKRPQRGPSNYTLGAFHKRKLMLEQALSEGRLSKEEFDQQLKYLGKEIKQPKGMSISYSSISVKKRPIL